MSGKTRVDVAALREWASQTLAVASVPRARDVLALLDVAEAAHRVEGNNGVIRNWRGLLDALARLDFGEGT